MSYKLDKPYTEESRLDFIVTYNHNQGLLIEETEDALYALEANEVMQEGVPVVDSNYETRLARAQADVEIAEIKEQLAEIDLKSIRALRAGEKDYLQEYEAEAVELRNRLEALE